MALELGLGTTPWSPLKSGALSGKYARANHGEIRKDRAAFLDAALNDHTYALVDELAVIAKEHASTVARVALAWLRAQPGVTSIIIGACRIGQLEDNVQSLNINLTLDQLGRPDAMTTPKFGFPHSMQPFFPSIHNGGITVNGVYGATSSFVLEKGATPY